MFNAESYSGAFANVILPPLSAGLGWNANTLNSNGTLAVVVATKPVIVAASISGGGRAFNGVAGVANANFYLLDSTKRRNAEQNKRRSTEITDDSKRINPTICGSVNFTDGFSNHDNLAFHLFSSAIESSCCF